MAKRPVYVADDNSYIKEFSIMFTWYNGFARIQKQRSIESLHHEFSVHNQNAKILEVSSFSDNELGRSLSAFRLMITMKDGTKVPVECAYQAGKVFENSGPYTDLLSKSPSRAKSDIRMKRSGFIREFRFDGQSFSAKPKSLFYSWLYLHALHEAENLEEQLMEYNSFTDIVYNPQNSLCSQAAICALYVSLKKKNELEKVLSDRNFLSYILLKMELKGVYCHNGETCRLERKQNENSNDKLNMDALMIDIEGEFNKLDKGEECTDDQNVSDAIDHLSVSDIIDHPIHGLGTVVGIDRDIDNPRIIVHFDGIKDRKFSEKWIKKHCLITKNVQ